MTQETRVLIFGSSISHGYYDEQGGWSQRFTPLINQQAASSNYLFNDSVYELGISGNTTQDLLERFSHEASARLSADKRNLIIFEIGNNDSIWFVAEQKHYVSLSAFQNNLQVLIDQTKEFSATPIFLGLTPVDKRVNPMPWRTEGAYRPEFVEQYDQALT